jgi:hypothetical protein
MGTHTSGTSQTHAKSHDADLSSFGSALNLDTEVGEQSWGTDQHRGPSDLLFAGRKIGDSLGQNLHLNWETVKHQKYMRRRRECIQHASRRPTARCGPNQEDWILNCCNQAITLIDAVVRLLVPNDLAAVVTEIVAE